MATILFGEQREKLVDKPLYYPSDTECIDNVIKDPWQITQEPDEDPKFIVAKHSRIGNFPRLNYEFRAL